MKSCEELKPLIHEDSRDLTFTDKNGQVLDVSTVSLEQGSIVSITTEDHEILDKENIILHRNLLHVPGIGWMCPGTRVVWNKKDYSLEYGWHINISNQTIYSWYLSSVGDISVDKTLYFEMIEEIESFHFR